MYVVGQPYKRVVAFKDGSPIYEMTAIAEVFPDKLVLANGTIIDYVPHLPGSGIDLHSRMQAALHSRPRRIMSMQKGPR